MTVLYIYTYTPLYKDRLDLDLDMSMNPTMGRACLTCHEETEQGG